MRGGSSGYQFSRLDDDMPAPSVVPRDDTNVNHHRASLYLLCPVDRGEKLIMMVIMQKINSIALCCAVESVCLCSAPEQSDVGNAVS